MAPCAACGATLENPLVCSACGVLASPSTPPTPFEVFGLEPVYALGAEGGAALTRQLLALTRRMQPDYFAAEPGQRELAERNSAELNAAHELLADDFRRADWLVRHLGGPDENAERAMPQAFLMEVLEWNEALEAARESEPGSSARELSTLRSDLNAQRAATLAELEALLTPLPAEGAAALTQARQRLNALRYLDRALRELATLALPRATG